MRLWVPLMRIGVPEHPEVIVADVLLGKLPLFHERQHAPQRRGPPKALPSSVADVAGGEPKPGADVAGSPVSPVAAQMWQGRAQSQRRCSRDEPSPGADVAGVSPVPAQMWQGTATRSSRGIFDAANR